MQNRTTDRSAGDLYAENVHVSYDRHQVVKGIGFRLKPGEFHTIIGPNGSGKSTLLKALTGELSFSGSVSLGGRSIRDISPRELAAQRGVLPQHTVLSFPLQVAEVVNLGILSQAASRSRLDRLERISDALKLVDLPGFEGRMYQTLSGGEQQRVQLARVMCQVWEPLTNHNTPRWLFLDEPVSSLDIKHQIQIMDVAADYARRGGGVLAVMHDLNLTASYADTVMVLRKGKISAHGSVSDVYRDAILSEAYDHGVKVSYIEGRAEPIVLARTAG